LFVCFCLSPWDLSQTLSRPPLLPSPPKPVHGWSWQRRCVCGWIVSDHNKRENVSLIHISFWFVERCIFLWIIFAMQVPKQSNLLKRTKQVNWDQQPNGQLTLKSPCKTSQLRIPKPITLSNQRNYG
jgi:hypothetical protein